MAHLQIPLSFEFRTVKVRWEEARAHVIGWRHEPATTKDTVHLIAEITSAGNRRTIGLPLSKLPAHERKQCLAARGKRQTDEIVKEICSTLDLRFFIHDVPAYIAESGLRKRSQPGDAWQLRDDLLRLKADNEAALAFLNKWGRWIPFRNYVDVAEIGALQQAVRHALTSPAGIWFRSLYASPPMVNSRSSEFPYFMMLTDACQEAICMTTTMDLLRQLKFKTCARPDCGMPFPITSKHERNYCQQYCAHLESVRRARKSTTQRSGR